MSSEAKIDELICQVDRALDELTSLAGSKPTVDVFLDNLLSQANLILGSKVSAFWHIGPDGNLLKSRAKGARVSESIPTQLQDEIRRCIEGSEPRRYKHGKGKKQIDVVLWPMNQFVPAAAMALYFKSGISSNEEPVVLRVIAAMAELADDYFAARVIAQRDQLEQNYSKLVKFSNVINSDLNARRTAITISNYSRDIFGCTRVSVLKRVGPVYALVASSGVQNVNRRANSSRLIENMSKRVLRRSTKTVIHIPGSGDKGAIPRKLDAYCAANDLKCLVMVPIRKGSLASKPYFVMTMEYKKEIEDIGSVIHSINSIEPQIRSALNNSCNYESLPFLMPMRGLRALLGIFGATKRLFYFLLILGLIGLTAFILFFTKSDLKVHMRGKLVAQSDSYVFAPGDGIVDRVFAQHGEKVEKGDPLLVLRSDQLELDIAEALGKLEIARKKLASEEVALSVFSQDGTPEGQGALMRLTGDTIGTTEQIHHYENEVRLLEIRKSKLAVNSPIEGEVASWDPERTLGGNRPVRRGDRLIQIVKTGDKWYAELDVPGDQIAHLLDDHFQIRDDLEVRLTIASAPDIVLDAKIFDIARVAEQNSETTYANVRVMVEFETEGDSFANIRPGTTVVANMNCGEVSVAYSLFHRVLLAIRFRFF